LYVPADTGIFNTSGLYNIHKAGKDRVPVLGQLTIDKDVLRRERMLNYSAHIVPGMRPRGRQRAHLAGRGGKRVALRLLWAAARNRDLNDFNRHLSTLFPVVNDFSIRLYRKSAQAFNKVMRSRQRFEVFRLNHMTEQTPNPHSRVTLSNERDALDQNRVQLHWQLCSEDIRSIIRAQQIIDEELRQAELGQLEIEMENDAPPPNLHGGWHHMGTTRMHRDPKQGVVDENAKVHGISNLYIAGPSVFPTSGYANPVLTIVALTARLADRIKVIVNERPKSTVKLHT
ncbi:MAG: GMC family oxidoreductase, partial [Candidatus Binatia bacterium]